jgi:hypothetical protein
MSRRPSAQRPTTTARHAGEDKRGEADQVPTFPMYGPLACASRSDRIGQVVMLLQGVSLHPRIPHSG